MSISPENPPCIELRDVTKSFPVREGARRESADAGRAALVDVTLSIAAGEFVCLLGPSGCGKSTILSLLAGFDAPTRGTVSVGGRPVTEPQPDRGMVFQRPNLFPWLTVLENITFGPRMAGVPRDEYLPKAQRYLKLVGLQGFEGYAPWQLSGGMQQRAALARAWLPGPDVLLMDEPFGALDAQTRLMMQELLTHIWETERPTILFVTHDVDEALFLADRILVMSARPGTLVEDLPVTLPRPRNIETFASEAGVGKLRQHILHRVRDEVRASMALPG